MVWSRVFVMNGALHGDIGAAMRELGLHVSLCGDVRLA